MSSRLFAKPSARHEMRNDEQTSTQDSGMHPLDAMTAAPEHHKVLLENEYVRVLDTRLGPGEQTPVHAHQWPAVLCVIGWSDFVRHDAEGRVLVDSKAAGLAPALGTSIWGGPLPPHYV